jgi:TPR repeat protein
MTEQRRSARKESTLPRHLRAMERAAKRGNAFAQYNLAAHLASGDEVERDFKRAIFWYAKQRRRRSLKPFTTLASCRSSAKDSTPISRAA